MEKKTDLEAQNEELRRRVFIAESMVQELAQALSRAQLMQAQLNAQLKLSNQPTA